MRKPRLARQVVITVLLLFLLPTAVAEVILIVLHRRGAFPDASVLLVTTLVGLLAMALYVSLVAHALGRSLVRTIQDIRRGAELIATVNPDHRTQVRTGDELEELAEEINVLADCLRDARLRLDAKVADATRDLEAERVKLAAVLADFPDGVVVASLDGRIALANTAAEALLNGSQGLLGRSVFEFVDRQRLEPGIDRLRAGRVEVERLALTSPVGALRIRMTALRGEGRGVTGLILAIREESAGEEAASLGLISSPRFLGAGLASGTGPTPDPPQAARPDFSLLEDAERDAPIDPRCQDLARATFVVFDVETTGLSPETGDQVVSLAGVRVRAGKVRPGETFDALVQPEREIPQASTRFHGIADAVVAGAPRIDQVLPAFIRFAGEDILVGHEVAFDLAFLERDAKRLGIQAFAPVHPVLDTRLLSRLVHGPDVEHTLEAAAGRVGVAVRGRHSALGDALVTADVLVRLLTLLRRRGIHTVGQAVEATQSFPKRA